MKCSAFTPDPPLQVILIAEDEDLIRGLLCDFLREAGFRVLAVASASAAREVIAKHTAVDLVLTDINMPGDMDGRALANWLSFQRPDIPVILTSGLVRAQPCGERRRFIAKPFTLD
jgi:CheY-like chemotaxis protein